jgi:hypothetical protein
MSMKIYQIMLPGEDASPASEGFFDRLWRDGTEQFQRLPLGAKIAGGVIAGGLAIVAAPIEASVVALSAGAAAGAAVAGAVSWAFSSDNNPVTTYITNDDDLKRYKHHEGGSFVNFSFYVEHPYHPLTLIPSSIANDVFVKEQIDEITSFLRSKLLVTSLKIEVRGSKSGRVGADTSDAGLHAGYQQGFFYSSENVYRNPAIVQPERPLVWMSQFKNIQSSVNESVGGYGVFVEKKDFSFGLTAEYAKKVGIGIDWVMEKTFRVEVEYGMA